MSKNKGKEKDKQAKMNLDAEKKEDVQNAKAESEEPQKKEAPAATAEAPASGENKPQTEKEKLAAAKETASAKVGDKKKVTVDTIKFRSNSGSGAVFQVLKEAKEPLTAEKITELAKKKMASIKDTRIPTVLGWFKSNNIAVVSDGKYALAPSTAGAQPEPAPSK